jgi:superfamily II RNA helicase
MVIICKETYNDSNYSSYFELFPYELSDFQKYAIQGIVEGNHVLVTAHTGSGKTLPAEFAIRHFVSNKKKVIYTSPIKALSNQKFYEFTMKYPEISFGLMTGDIKTNPDADVLIMTTEILMNYLYSLGSSNSSINSTLQFQIDIQNELGCVIFDEVHYINDKDRGHVWEQTILMLPQHIQMVLLSATIDNPSGFAEWIENRGYTSTDSESNKKTVYLASTEHRVVPLTHYGFFTTTETPFKEIKDKEIQQQIRDSCNKLVLLRDPLGKFNDAGYYEIHKMRDLFDKHRFYMKRKFVLNKLMWFLKENEMLPCIVFVFSRKNVEVCAHEITTNLLEDDSKVPYTVRTICEQIIRKFPNFKEYLELPEYNDLVSLLEKGIGIHHSGMIPVLREIVELMISKRYIKVLFATESFAIGLDCPIKTAVFSSLTKFDGTGLRSLMPHEYTQMAGRAGRRGIDTVGHVVHCSNLFEMPGIQDYRQILCGKPQKLVSKFKISYSVVLNLLKNGKTAGFHEFVDKSMMKKELENSISMTRNTVVDLHESYEKKTGLLDLLRTPIEICKEYIETESCITMYSSKKRKEMERKMANYKDSYKWLLDDVCKLKEHDTLKKKMDSETSELTYLENYSKIHIDKVCRILLDDGFVIEREGGVYELTQWGQVASCINEIHPLIATKMLEHWNWFADFSITQILSIFSLFTDVNVPEDFKRLYTKENTYTYIGELVNDYAKRELEGGLFTGIDYDNLCVYDLIVEMPGWVACDTEVACKYFIQTVIMERGISIGDFTKAILKISVITKEFIGVCELVGDLGVELLHKLKSVDSMILKYVATSQSLYV